jgi:hypothetical protein
MSGNIFKRKRFILLFKQHFIHYNQLFVLAAVAYIGMIFIALSVTQLSNNLVPHNFDIFQGFLVGFVLIFGILYAGHAFPAFRTKESTINYLMLPGSLFEKFLLEFIVRIVFMIVALPLLYWITFHLQGYAFSMFTSLPFEPLGIQNLTRVDSGEENFPMLIKLMVGSVVMLGFVVSFTGAAMFSIQPLVKSLFSVAIIVLFFMGYSFLIAENFGLNTYNPPSDMWLVPLDDSDGLILLSSIFIFTSLVMLIVAYLKLKEKEV